MFIDQLQATRSDKEVDENVLDTGVEEQLSFANYFWSSYDDHLQ